MDKNDEYIFRLSQFRGAPTSLLSDSTDFDEPFNELDNWRTELIASHREDCRRILKQIRAKSLQLRTHALWGKYVTCKISRNNRLQMFFENFSCLSAIVKHKYMYLIVIRMLVRSNNE